RQSKPAQARPRAGARLARRGVMDLPLYRSPQLESRLKPGPLRLKPGLQHLGETLAMWFISLFHRPHKHLSRVGVGRSANPSRHTWSFTPRLELLEDRALLSTLTVLNNLDSGTGSLRDTIKSANSGDTIVFASSLTRQ